MVEAPLGFLEVEVECVSGHTHELYEPHLGHAPDPRGHVLHLKTPEMEWTDQGEEGSRYRFKQLSMDPETKAYSALLALDPGWSGRLSTDSKYGREWLMLSGSQTGRWLLIRRQHLLLRPTRHHPCSHDRLPGRLRCANLDAR